MGALVLCWDGVEEEEEEEEEEECDAGFCMIQSLSKEIAIQQELQEWVRKSD